MAQITITIPDNVVADVLDALADLWEWDGSGTKAAFVRGEIRDRLKREYLRAKQKQDRDAYNAPAEPDIKTA